MTTPPGSTAPLQNPEVGKKEVWYSSRLLVEGEDAAMLKVGDKVTLINWGNVLFQQVNK